MKTARRMTALVLALVFALALSACGQGGGQDGGQDAASDEVQFQGFDARPVDELGNLAEAAMAEAESLDADDADSQQEAKASSEFQDGNVHYRAKDYAQATEAYHKALEYDPKNHGANVNLTLSLMQEGRDDEALAQALRCVALFPDDAGCLLNAQAAGTACRFSSVDLDIWLEIIVEERGNTSISAVRTPSAKDTGDDMVWDEAYIYNALWNRIETELYPGEKTWENAGEIDPRDAYLEMRESLSELGSDDDDVAALQAYLDAVANQLGLSESV